MKKKLAYSFKISMIRKTGAFTLFAIGITWFFFEPLKVDTDLAKVLFNETLTFGEYQYFLTFYEHYIFPIIWFSLASPFAFFIKKGVIKDDHLYFKGTFMGLPLFSYKKVPLSSYQEIRIIVSSQMQKAASPLGNINFFSVSLKNNHTLTDLDRFASYQGALHFGCWLKEVTNLAYADHT